MTRPAESPADARHWRRSRRLAAVLAALWLLAWFVPLLFARQLDAWLGTPVATVLCAFGIPLVFLLLAWVSQRGMERLDDEHRAGRVD